MPDVNWGMLAPINQMQPIQTASPMATPAPTPAPPPSQGNPLSSLSGLLGGLKQAVGPTPGMGAATQATLQHQLQNTPQQQVPSVMSGQSPMQSNVQGMRGAAQQNLGQSKLYDTASQLLGKGQNDPQIQQYLQKVNPGLDPRQTPWCAGFVGSVLGANGIKGTGSLAAKSYLKWGQATDSPTTGDLVVFNDLTGKNDPVHGHVGFYAGKDSKGNILTLGGNEGHQVAVKAYPASQVAGFRVPPTGDQVQKIAQSNNIQTPQQLANIHQNQDITPILRGIAHVESGGETEAYLSKSVPDSRGNRSYGKYQVSASNIPSWTKETLGHSMTPDQFLHDPQAQEKVAQARIKGLLNQGYNPQDVASIWFSGRPQQQAGNAKDAYGTTVPQYVKKFNEGYNSK